MGEPAARISQVKGCNAEDSYLVQIHIEVGGPRVCSSKEASLCRTIHMMLRLDSGAYEPRVDVCQLQFCLVYPQAADMV